MILTFGDLAIFQRKQMAFHSKKHGCQPIFVLNSSVGIKQIFWRQFKKKNGP
jgi:hypothetical protein